MGILNNLPRLVLEHDRMKERWGEAPRLRISQTGCWWEVPIRLEGNRFDVKIIYTKNYPASPPQIVVVTPMPENTPHLLPGQVVCWLYPGETRNHQNRWSPAEDTAVLAVGVAYRWFLAFLIWSTTGQWPVPDALSR